MICFNLRINIEYSLLVVSIRQKKYIISTKITCPEFKQEKNLEENEKDHDSVKKIRSSISRLKQLLEYIDSLDIKVYIEIKAIIL